ncbi:InlB B-repeat-containing protein [Clostridium sp.]|uniref:InlB B-repeat-containing protein n=1 Tax=Clostridium sp. TaxID=1506 RepID=UPI0025B81099|nr:InlB B-repeat-containing protein [Clostridium sp.]
MKRRKKAKVLSFLLCILLIFTTFTPMSIRASAEDEDGNINTTVSSGETITVTPNGKEVLTAPNNMIEELQWQFYSDEYNKWINIYGEKGNTCTLTYAKVYNMIHKNGQTQIRCTQITGGIENTSDSVTVILDNKYQEVEKINELSNESTEADPIVVNDTVENFATYTASAENADISNIQTYDETDSIETENSTNETYSIVINYVFENNEIAAEPYTATLAAGSSFSATVNYPTILGYLPYVNDVQQNSVNLNYTDIQKDYTINVVYKPTNVDYTVIHYQQNVDNDNYTEVERETKQGLTNSTVPEVAKTYEGYYALLYEKPAIAADGSTVVEVYYDRYYYLMNFDLDGGYGVEPIYARYGTQIGNVGTPTKAGYTFQGWSLDGTTTVELTTTMPAENRTYHAIWKVDATAKVTVVIWGENANDEEYSYIKSSEIYAKPGETITFGSGQMVCALESHQHSLEECYELTCTQEEHTHSEDCYTCGQSSHTHGTSCYDGVGDVSSPGLGAPSNPSNGYITRRAFSRDGKVIYINGTWYNYSGSTASGSIAPTTCGQIEHTHSEDCLGCGKTEHTHSVENGCYTLTCTKTEHTHSDDCYLNTSVMDTNLWTYVKSDEVTVAADGSTIMNVYFDRKQFTITFKATGNNGATLASITDKWGADIKERFETISKANTFLWSQKTSGDSPWTSFMDVMPAENRTYYANTNNSTRTHTATYYGEKLDGSGYEVLYTVQVKYDGNLTVSEEEFEDIEGFTFNADKSTKIGRDYNGAEFYYDRNSYNLIFNDGYDDVKTELVKYQASLATYQSYTPDVPSAYEPGSVTFGGWYLNPECTGTEYDLSSHTMPAANLILYAKWVPVTHTVEFYLTQEYMESDTKIGETHPDLIVEHGSKVEPTPETPTNSSYTFVGWFYMEDGVEKAFDFANMPINKDMKVYGKWSSNVLKNYSIYYKIQGTDTEIAAPTTGSGLAGITKTFDAKGDTDLYADYQEGYFPLVKSHSLTIDIDNDANNTFTFWYVQKEAVPYMVKYLNAETGEPVATEKIVSDNRKAVVTETFVPVAGMMPDAYQKRLVVSAEDGAVNEIIFYYTEDTTHAYYKITHYTENLAKDSNGNTTWTEYASSQAVGDINTTYSADPLTISGFTYDSTVEGTVVSGELTANGLELKLYYTRNSYPYEVRYLEQGTGKQLAEPKRDTGKYGEVISESAIDIENYQAVDPTSQNIDVKVEEGTEAKINIITFYYKEKPVDLTITKTGVDKIDENQSFIFHVTGSSGIDLTVTIVGNGSITIKDLPHGTYTITEETDWSWRYTPDKSSQTIKLPQDGNNVVFKNSRNDINKWLNGNAHIKNIFKGISN